MIRYFLRSFFYHRSPLKPSRWRYLTRLFTIMIFAFTLLSFLIPFIYSILVFLSSHSESNASDTIISLTSTPKRFHYELPFAIHSLLSQTQLPKLIRIYLSPTSIIITQNNLTLRHLKLSIQRLDSSITIAKLFDRLVEIQLESEDYGPATKFLPILKEFGSNSQAIMICDDDQYYHPYTLETLDKHANQFPNSIIGFRGWRVRKDLIWGVRGTDEVAYHIIEARHLSEAYRVGVVTATDAYLIRPSFFDSHIYRDFNQVPNDIRHVDDIWLNGQASRQNIARYIVPSCCTHISVTRTHALEESLRKHRMNRLSANSHALNYFADSWEKDLWYRFNGENGPKYRNWWLIIYREWIDIILNLKFIFYFGLI